MRWVLRLGGLVVTTALVAHRPHNVRNFRHAGRISDKNRLFLPRQAAISAEDTLYSPPEPLPRLVQPLQSLGVASFITLAAAMMPFIVAPLYLLEKVRLLSRRRRESWCLKAICHWVRFLSPLAFSLQISGRMPTDEDGLLLWSSNHISNADFFAVLAAAPKLCRRRSMWPRVIYWQGLEKNPLFKLFGRSCGMVPVAMENTGSGNENVYDTSSFRRMYMAGIGILQSKTDLAILPEGQLNPRPWQGLQRVYPGPYSFSKRADAAIQMVGLYGTEHIWQAGKPYPMPKARDVRIHLWPPEKYQSPDDFVAAFKTRIEPWGLRGEAS